MASIKSKSVKKRIKTTLKVKLMEGKTLRDMYHEFYKDKAPKGFEDIIVRTVVSLDGQSVDYDLYKKFSGIGASKEFLESFSFRYIREHKIPDSDSMVEAIYRVIPFVTLTGISSYILSYTVGCSRLDSLNDLELEIETFSWRDYITSDDIKRINKENARKLKYYLVGLPSVQGVPFSCSYREDEMIEQECSV